MAASPRPDRAGDGSRCARRWPPRDEPAASSRPPNAWQKLRAIVELSVVVAESLSLDQQIGNVLQDGGFTAKRQPASYRPRSYAPSELLDDSDGESEVDGSETDDEYFPPPSRADRFALGRVAAIVGLRPPSGSRSPRSNQGARPQPLFAPPAPRSALPDLPQRATAEHDFPEAASKTERRKRKGKKDHAAGPESPPRSPSDTGASSELGGAPPPPRSLPLADEGSGRKSRPRRGKGRKRLSRSLLTSDEKEAAKQRDKARRQRNKAQTRDFHAILSASAALQRRMRSQTAQAAKDRRLAAPKMLALLRASAVVRADIPLQRMFHGTSFFTNTYHVLDDEKGHLFAQGDGAPLPPPQSLPLHADCNDMVRNLVQEDGYTYVTNDFSRPQVFVDANGRPFAIKAQQPVGAWCRAAVGRVTGLLEDLRAKLKLRPDSPNVSHTRGRFNRFTFGASHGGGQKRPTRIAPDWTKHNEQLIIEFLHDPAVVDVIQHMESCVFTWLPDIAALYKKLEANVEVPAALRTSRLFNLPFAAHTFNLGPYVQCWFHRDARNFVLGWCPVFVMGNFDHRTSGQFIMVEPRLVVELRPGDIMLMMSSVITHGTAPLRPGETRLSWTCFTAGAFFRWDAAGQKLVGDLTDEEHVEYEARSRKIFTQAWRANLTLEELQQRYEAEAGVLAL